MHLLPGLTIFLISLRRTQAESPITSVKLPSYNVTAGTDTRVSITLAAGLDAINTPVNFTVSLYSSASNWEMCTLPAHPIADTTFTISIPPSAGPPGAYYRLALVPATAAYGPAGITYSSIFHLAGARGVFTSEEVISGAGSGGFFGGALYGAPGIPCAIVACARACYKRFPAGYVTEGVSWTQTTVTIVDSRFVGCVEACPGAEVPFPRDERARTSTLGATATAAAMVEGASAVTDVLPLEGCDVAGGETSCGSECCKRGVNCFYWNHCSKGTSDDYEDPRVSFTLEGGSGGPGTRTGTVTSLSTGAATPTARVVGVVTSTTALSDGGGRMVVPGWALGLLAFL